MPASCWLLWLLHTAADPAQATSEGQAAVLGIAPLLSAAELELHVLMPLDGLARPDEDAARAAPCGKSPFA